jgi:hypothetical protein
MTEDDGAAEPPAPRRTRWTPPRRDAQGSEEPTREERQGFVQRYLADAAVVARRTIPSRDADPSSEASPDQAPAQQPGRPTAASEGASSPGSVAKADQEPMVVSPAPAAKVAPVADLPPERGAQPEPAVEHETVDAANEPSQGESGSARELPIHEWVNAGADHEPDPAWPQELVRAGLERSRRSRQQDPDESYF